MVIRSRLLTANGLHLLSRLLPIMEALHKVKITHFFGSNNQ